MRLSWKYLTTRQRKPVSAKTLRRIQVTPVSPAKLFLAEFRVYVIYCIVSTLTLFPAAMLFWKIKIHGSFLIILGKLAFDYGIDFEYGVGGTAKNMESVSVITYILYFPMLIFSGAPLPYEVIEKAVAGEPEAADTVLRHYTAHTKYLSMYKGISMKTHRTDEKQNWLKPY